LYFKKKNTNFVENINQMKYNIGDKVIVNNSKKIKTIVDSEIINEIEIYYMSDNTSFSVYDIKKYDEFLEILNNMVDNQIDRAADFYLKKNSKIIEKNKVSWFQECYRWWKWQLTFK
jgi:hypothetical protein